MGKNESTFEKATMTENVGPNGEEGGRRKPVSSILLLDAVKKKPCEVLVRREKGQETEREREVGRGRGKEVKKKRAAGK